VERNVRSRVAKLPALVIARRARLAIPAGEAELPPGSRTRDDDQRREGLVEWDEMIA
jgi:hypothetical protein